jgi:hypothetical protein
MKLHRLIALNAKIDQINFQHPYDEEESHGLRNTAIGAGVLGAGTAGGLYAAGRGVSGPVRGGTMGVADTISKGYGRAAGYAGTVKDTITNSGVGQAFTKGADRAAYAGEGRLASILRGLRGAARSVTKGRSKMVGLSARHSQLVQLNARLDALINL